MLPTNPLLSATAPAGPHLPVALLRQYAAGTLAPAAQHRVEAHTLACPRCADVLDGLLQTPAATTDQALAQLHQRLRKRVQQHAAPARLASSQQPHRWLAPQLAAAAALILGLVAGGWWTWQQRHPAASGAAPIAAGRLATEPALATAPIVAAPTAPAPAASASAPTPPPAAGLARQARVATVARQGPAPVGGYAALRAKLRREAAAFVPPAPGRPLSGTVRLRLLIDAAGKIQKINVLHGLRADYDAEAQRLVRNGPAWMPGAGGGRQAAQAVEIAIPF